MPFVGTLVHSDGARILLDVQEALARGEHGKVLIGIAPELFGERARATKYVIGDMDGTFVVPGMKQMPERIVAQDYELGDADIKKVYCTGKPASELEAIRDRLLESPHYRADAPYPADFLLEKGCFIARIEPGGALVVKPHLVSGELVTAIDSIRRTFESGWQDELSRAFDVRLELAGDGTHRGVFSVDVLRADRPDDFRAEKYGDRTAIKEAREDVVKEVFAALELRIADLGAVGARELDARPIGMASYEFGAHAINKAAAVRTYFANEGVSPTIGVAVAGDSRNDLELYVDLRASVPGLLSCHTCWDAECVDMALLTDCAVVGQTSAFSFVSTILNEVRGRPAAVLPPPRRR